MAANQQKDESDPSAPSDDADRTGEEGALYTSRAALRAMIDDRKSVSSDEDEDGGATENGGGS